MYFLAILARPPETFRWPERTKVLETFSFKLAYVLFKTSACHLFRWNCQGNNAFFIDIIRLIMAILRKYWDDVLQFLKDGSDGLAAKQLQERLCKLLARRVGKDGKT